MWSVLWLIQPNVRAAALTTLNTFMKVTFMRDMFVSDDFGTVLGKANPFVKQEVYGWMGGHLMKSKRIVREELTAFLRVLYASIEDPRNSWFHEIPWIWYESGYG